MIKQYLRLYFRIQVSLRRTIDQDFRDRYFQLSSQTLSNIHQLIRLRLTY